jgi:tetratricopeptide (TPR) repeat protein
MGRSLAPLSLLAARRMDEEAAHPGFEMFNIHYAVERRGRRVFHKQQRKDAHGQVIAEIEDEVQFVLGSGEHGRSYLVDRDGYLFQTPISWYTQKQTWDLSPGFNANPTRPIEVLCLFCHSNEAIPVEHSVNRYRPPIFRGYAIGCERCHGPGELHVKRRQDEKALQEVDDTIVNPRHLEPSLREAVCQQCHLQGEEHVLRRGRQPFDFRPGLPLHLFWSVFMRAGQRQDSAKAVGHVEQMYTSRCFRESNGKMGCISCHDPHLLPAPKESVTYYRNRCLKCHQETSCSQSVATRKRQNPADNCVVCHMPKAESSNIAHTSITNHRIPRQPGTTEAQSGPIGSTAEYPLTLFHQDQRDTDDPDAGRDLGIALVNLSWHSERSRRRQLSEFALPLLQRAEQVGPEDIPAWEAKASVLLFLDRAEEARTAAETALAIVPQRERSLTLAALAAGEEDVARTYRERLLAVNPWSYSDHVTLARYLCNHQEWQKAIEECQAAVRINPFAEDARRWLILCYIRLGDEQKGRAEFDKAVALDPSSQKRLRRWLTDQLR